MGSDDRPDSAPASRAMAGPPTCARCARLMTRPAAGGLLCRECFDESVARGRELTELCYATRARLRSGELARDRFAAAAASAGFHTVDVLDGLGRLPDNTEADLRVYSSVRSEKAAQQRWRMRSPAARAGGCGGSAFCLSALAALLVSPVTAAACVSVPLPP
jgi:hypothetical protein